MHWDEATYTAAIPRYRSQTEARYAAVLEEEKRTGLILDYWYEPIKGLYLAPKTTYTPDFLVQVWQSPDHRTLVFHEVKGPFIREKDLIKAKVAARLYPCFRFLLVQWTGDEWTWQLIPNA